MASLLLLMHLLSFTLLAVTWAIDRQLQSDIGHAVLLRRLAKSQT